MKAVLPKSSDFKFSDYRRIHHKFILLTHNSTIGKSWNYANKHLSTTEQEIFEIERRRSETEELSVFDMKF